MTSNFIVAVLFTDYVFLYLGCTFDNMAFRLIGGICLLLLAIVTVLPERKKEKG